MSKDEDKNSVILNKEEALKKSIKFKQSAYSLIFKQLEEQGFPNELLLDEDPNSILSNLYRIKGGDSKQLEILRIEYKNFLVSEEKKKSIEDVIKEIGEEIHEFYDELLTISPLIQTGFSFFDEQRTEYLEDKDKKNL